MTSKQYEELINSMLKFENQNDITLFYKKITPDFLYTFISFTKKYHLNYWTNNSTQINPYNFLYLMEGYYIPELNFVIKDFLDLNYIQKFVQINHSLIENIVLRCLKILFDDEKYIYFSKIDKIAMVKKYVNSKPEIIIEDLDDETIFAFCNKINDIYKS